MAEGNPLLVVEHPIAFDRIRIEHVGPAVAALLSEAEETLSQLEGDRSSCTYDNTLGALERLGKPLGRAMTVVGHLESVATTPALREVYNEVQPRVSAFFSKIPLSAPVYERLKEFSTTPEAGALDATRKRQLERTLQGFEREGAALDQAGKDRLHEINVELSQLTTRFGQNVLDATNAFELCIEDRERLAGLPERVIAAAERSAAERGQRGFRFTLQEPSLVPVLTYLDDAEIREQVYRAYNARASFGEYDNRELLVRILELRKEKGGLLGYSHFVDLALSDRMAKDAATALEFVADLERRCCDAFEQEKRELLAFRRRLEGPEAATLEPWDVAYYAEKQRVARYAFDDEALRPYFPLERVLSGLFELVQRLYGIEVEPADELPVWHASVRAFRLRDADGRLLGAFYADLFPRDEKRSGAWMNAFITGEPQDDQAWSPHVGLICANLTPPSGKVPSLLSHREVETIFHEFGHLLHHLLTRVAVPSLAGTHVAWDFVELPSQIMENWCWEREALDLFARHYETGESIPEDLFSRMLRARTYRSASAMMRQLGFATVDLRLHTAYQAERDGEVVAFGRSVLSEFAPTPLHDDYAMITGFGHLFSHPVGYAGGYYSYKWAEVLDADAFSRFKREGLFSRQVGLEFRNKILARGDSREPMELFKDFMGREPSIKPLLERAGIVS